MFIDRVLKLVGMVREISLLIDTLEISKVDVLIIGV